MSAGLKRIDGLGGHGSGFFRASVKSALWLPLRLPIRYQKGLNPPLLATRIRRKYLALSAGYELLSKLQNLYVPVRSRPAPPIRSQQLIPDRGRNSLAVLWLLFTAVSILLLTESLMPSGVFLKKTPPCTIFRCQRVNRNRSSCRISRLARGLLDYSFCRQITPCRLRDRGPDLSGHSFGRSCNTPVLPHPKIVLAASAIPIPELPAAC